MRLEPLYRLRFTYLQTWEVNGPDKPFFGIAEGRCEGAVTGRLSGANSPRLRGDNVYLPNIHAVVETDDGAAIAVHIAGIGVPREDGEREFLGTVTHECGDERYAWLNTALCPFVAEARGEEIVIDVATLIWEPLGD